MHKTHTCGQGVPYILPELVFSFNDTATTEIYTLSLHDALPIWRWVPRTRASVPSRLSPSQFTPSIRLATQSQAGSYLVSAYAVPAPTAPSVPSTVR